MNGDPFDHQAFFTKKIVGSSKEGRIDIINIAILSNITCYD